MQQILSFCETQPESAKTRRTAPSRHCIGVQGQKVRVSTYTYIYGMRYRKHPPRAASDHRCIRPRATRWPNFLPSAAERFNIVTCGDLSDKLSMYDSTTSGTVSRGVLNRGRGERNGPAAFACPSLIVLYYPVQQISVAFVSASE